MRADLPVTLRFLSTEAGGRPLPVNSGYRAQVVFCLEGTTKVAHDSLFDFSESRQTIEREGEKWLPLGVEASAVMAPFDADRMSDVISVGVEFSICEGRTLVGAGRLRADRCAL
jgi:hypothetical protein